MVENAKDLIALIDLQGRYLYVSPSDSSILGYPPEELHGKLAFAFVHPDDQAAAQAVLRRVLTTGSGELTEFRARHNGGHWLFVEGQGVLLRDAAGQPQLVLASARDITARKQAEEYLAFQAHVSDAVIAIDNEHRIIFWNPAAEQLYGFGAAEVLGRLLEEITHYQWLNQADEAAAYETLGTRGSWQGENWHTTRHGERLHVESTAVCSRMPGDAPSACSR